MSAFEIVADHSDPGPDAAALERAIDEYNLETTGDRSFWPITLTIRDDAGRIRGGLVGMIWAGWLDIKVLWLDAALRGAGHGSRLLRQAEDYARERGARHAQLESFTFQAPGFYEKHGYVRFAELEDYPAGHSNVFLRKDLAAPIPADAPEKHSDAARASG
jgi:ribosomal protein S18 acetylase RimI-like enzyme